MALRWNHSNEVFVPEMDAEHRVLFGMVEELRRTVNSKTGSAKVADGIRALLSETQEHFGHEERLMSNSAFWGAKWHTAQHGSALKHLRNALKAYEKGDGAKAERELKAMGSWLNDHTSIADRILGAFLRNHDRETASHR